MSKLFSVTAVLALTMVAGCAAGRMKLSEMNSGETVEMKVGDEMRVSLETEPTGDLWWTYDTPDNAVLEVVDQSHVEQAPKDGGVIGVAGKQTWRLRAYAPGQTTLSFSSRRRGETGGADRVVTFNVIVLARD